MVASLGRFIRFIIKIKTKNKMCKWISWSFHTLTIINECFRSEKMKYYCVQCSMFRHKQYICFDLRANVPINGLTDKKTIITLFAKSFCIIFLVCCVSRIENGLVINNIIEKETQQQKKIMSPITINSFDCAILRLKLDLYLGFVFIYVCQRCKKMREIERRMELNKL